MYHSRSYKAGLVLRIGLAAVFAYAAAKAFLHPLDWVGFVPAWIERFGVTRDRALFGFSLFESALALLLLSNFKPKFMGLVSFVFLMGILLVSGFGVLDITFRDFGLAMAALALFLVS